MEKFRSHWTRCLVKAAALVLGVASLGFLSGDLAFGQDHPVLSTGKIGAKATDLQIATEKLKERVVVRLNVPKEVFVAAVYLSPEGDATLVIPSTSIPDCRLVPGNEYTLFGPDAALQLKPSGKTGASAKMAFFVSSKPLSLDPLTIPEGKPFVRIPASDEARMKILSQKLQTLSEDEGFNRKGIELEPGAKLSVRLDQMGLPTAVKSGKPTGVLGVQGAKEEAEGPGKQ